MSGFQGAAGDVLGISTMTAMPDTGSNPLIAGFSIVSVAAVAIIFLSFVITRILKRII